MNGVRSLSCPGVRPTTDRLSTQSDQRWRFLTCRKPRQHRHRSRLERELASPSKPWTKATVRNRPSPGWAVSQQCQHQKYWLVIYTGQPSTLYWPDFFVLFYFYMCICISNWPPVVPMGLWHECILCCTEHFALSFVLGITSIARVFDCHLCFISSLQMDISFCGILFTHLFVHNKQRTRTLSFRVKCKALSMDVLRINKCHNDLHAIVTPLLTLPCEPHLIFMKITDQNHLLY